MTWLLLLALLLTAALCDSPEKNGKLVTWESDVLGIRVDGGQGVPDFTIYNIETSEEWRYKFKKLHESTDGTVSCSAKVPTSNKALASVSWTVSDISEQDGVASFSVSTGATADAWDDLALYVHVNSSASDTSRFKFDIYVESYVWTSDTSYLVLTYSVEASDGSDLDVTENADGSISVGESFFDASDEVELDATAAAASISADGSDAAAPKIYLVYPHFTTTLFHDPVLGISGALSDAVPVWIWVVGGVIAIAIVVGVIIIILQCCK
eukprot:gnl/Chilomastix_cuspidata/2106.p1 GENE.gnl/Chilomastix_cuspidata/2106~~gnl/Chilomastix_cuspidata/2106.p1  ORF type:complete len:268 (-),score=94.23 gnl/Chilomastix_cuspidata/2106:162-965(-)